MPVFLRCSRIDAPAGRVFAWHLRPEAIRQLIPPGVPVSVEQPPRSLQPGERAIVRIAFGPLRLRWVAQHTRFIDRAELGGEFTDIQLKGPFRRWEHTHRVIAHGAAACLYEDRIDYELPLAFFTGPLLGRRLDRALDTAFDYRHRIVRAATEQKS